MDEVAQLSGLADMSATDLAHRQSAFQTRVNTQRHTYHRGIGGSSPSNNLKLLLEMLHQKLTPGAQQFKPSALQRAVTLQLQSLKHRDKSPEFLFGERARLSAYGDQPIQRPLSADMLEGVTTELLSHLYHSGFTACPTDFRFVFVVGGHGRVCGLCVVCMCFTFTRCLC